MSDPLDDFFEEPEIIKEEPPRPRKIRRPGRFLNLLSGIFVAGTIVAGLFFAILFINPQSSLNPLPPTTMPAPFMTYTPSPTFKSVLQPTWTPTISPTETPTLTPIPTDTPLPTIEKLPDPTADLESGVTIENQDGSPTYEASAVHIDAGCNWLGVASEIYDMDDLPDNTLLTALLDQILGDSTFTAPLPTEQFLTIALPLDEGISDLFTPEIQYWEEDILAWGEEYGLDPNLIATVMQIESCGYAKAKSVAGATGLFQVMPQHFKEEEDPYDPDTNAYRGLSWLKKTLISGGSTKMALAGYNAGIARAKIPDLEWSNETQRYVIWGLIIYQDAKCGHNYSSALQNWLSKGGSSLCNKAAVEQEDK